MDRRKLLRKYGGYFFAAILMVTVSMAYIIKFEKYQDVVAGYDVIAWEMLMSDSGNLIFMVETESIDRTTYINKLENLENITAIIACSPYLRFMERSLGKLLGDLKDSDGDLSVMRLRDLKRMHNEMRRLSVKLQSGEKIDQYFSDEKNQALFEQSIHATE